MSHKDRCCILESRNIYLEEERTGNTLQFDTMLTPQDGKIDCSGKEFGQEKVSWIGSAISISVVITSVDLPRIYYTISSNIFGKLFLKMRQCDDIGVERKWHQRQWCHSTFKADDEKRTHLDLSDRISRKGAIALASSKTMTHLALVNNYVDDEGAVALSKIPTLSELLLEGNDIKSAGAAALAESTSLNVLDLQDNLIGSVGAIAIGSVNVNITDLYLYNTFINDDGATALAAHPCLNYLNLNSNRISNAGATALAANCTISAMYLGRNQFSDAGVTALSENRTLKELHLYMSNVTDAGERSGAKSNSHRTRSFEQLSLAGKCYSFRKKHNSAHVDSVLQ